MSKKYTNELIEFYIQDGILYGIYITPILSLEVAQEIVKQRLLFTGVNTYPVLADIRNIKSVTLRPEPSLQNRKTIRSYLPEHLLLTISFWRLSVTFLFI